LICVFPYFASKAKTWPAGRWAEVLRRLLARNVEKIVLIGGKDSALATEGILHALNDDRVTSLVGKLSLGQTAAILNRCVLYIGCDTGVSHLATALGKKTVVLFGSSDERKWGPPAHKGSSISCWVPCRPCSIFGYEKKCHTIDCMDRISVDAVWKEVERYLV